MSEAVVTRKDIDEVISIVRDFMDAVDTRFDKLETDVTTIKIDVEGIKEKLVNFEASHERLVNTIDGFLGRIDKYEIEQAARDSQFERLLTWARKVSEKTGIPLENL